MALLDVDTRAYSIAGDSGTQSGMALDSAYVFATSGDCLFARFVSPVTQSSGALTFYVYCTAVTGTPTIGIEMRNGPASGDDADRPEAGGSTIGTPGGDVTPTANRWATFTMSGLSLTRGLTYYIILKNTHATPASNHATMVYRGARDANGVMGALMGINLLTQYDLGGGVTTNGFSADPTTVLLGTQAPFVIKFDSGDIMGNPWVSTSNHANDANDRGCRVSFTDDEQLHRVNFALSSTSLNGLEITKVSDSSVVLSVSLTDNNDLRSHTTPITPTTLSAGVAYNIVLTASGATTVGTRAYMGETDANLPADVKACKPPWFLGFVGGATSPGSYTLTEGLAIPMVLASNAVAPVATGSSSSQVFGG